MIGRHPYWANFKIDSLGVKNIDISRSSKEELSEYLGMPIPRINGALLLRNSVEPKVGKHIFECALRKYNSENKLKQNYFNMKTFEQYHNENPQIYKAFKHYALIAKQKGFKNYSAKIFI